MWSVQLSERRKQQSFFLFWLAALNISFMSGAKPEPILQSCPVVARYAEELDAALAIYIQCLRSCNRGVSEDQSINTTAEGGALQHPLATVRIKTRFRNVPFHLVLSLDSSGEGSWIRHFHSTIAWFKTAHETSDLWWTTSMQRHLCNHGIIRRFGHSQNVSWYFQEAKSGSVLIEDCTRPFLETVSWGLACIFTQLLWRAAAAADDDDDPPPLSKCWLSLYMNS